MAHDLDAILSEVLAHFAPMPTIHITWVEHRDAARHHNYWGQAWWTRDGRFLGISKRLHRAPKYVIRYVVFHEVLHVALGTTRHHKAFRIAERLWSKWERAERWLKSHS